MVKNPPANAGDIRDMGSISGSERHGGGHGNQPQYSCVGNSTEEPGGLQSMGSHKDRTEMT